MENKTLGHELSPLRQARRNRSVELADRKFRLSPRDQRDLKRILTEKYQYVDSEAFAAKNAYRTLFEEAPKIKRPDTSWYHPVMETASTQALRAAKGGAPGAALLSAAEERALFLQFNYARYRTVKLKESLNANRLTFEQSQELLHWFRLAEDRRDLIAQTNLALVLAMAKRTRMSEVDFVDLVSEGNMALLRAVDKFDVARGFKFSTYACRAILKAFSRSGVKLSKYRQLFPTEFDSKLERSDYMERRRQTHEEDCVSEIRDILRDNRADLSEIERQVITHRFGIGKPAPATPKPAARSGPTALTLEQVGRIIGVTKERVRQIQNKALEKIRDSLEVEYLT